MTLASRLQKSPRLAAHLQGDVINLDIVGAPFAKELNLRGLSHGRGIVPVSHWELKIEAYLMSH